MKPTRLDHSKTLTLLHNVYTPWGAVWKSWHDTGYVYYISVLMLSLCSGAIPFENLAQVLTDSFGDFLPLKGLILVFVREILTFRSF